MKLKIYNIDVVDCSSSWNEVVPNPESRQLLIDIFLKICESEAIKAITSHSLILDFKGSKDMLAFHTDIEFRSPEAYGFNRRVDFCSDIANFDFKSGKDAETDKVAGLFIEHNAIALKHLEDEKKQFGNNLHLLPPGLHGIRRSIALLKSYYSRNFNNLPRFCQKTELRDFILRADVVWKEWVRYQYDPEYGQVITGEHDEISADSKKMQLHLGSICEGGHQGRENGSKHYSGIQKVLDQNWPTLFEVKELNGG